MDTIARRIRKGKLDHHPALAEILKRDRNGRQTAFTAYGKDVPVLERELLHRLLVFLGLIGLQIDFQVRLALTNSSMLNFIKTSVSGYNDILREEQKIDRNKFGQYMGWLNPLHTDAWTEDQEMWINVLEACEDFFIMWCYARPGLYPLYKKAPQFMFNEWVEEMYAALPVTNERKAEFSALFDIDVPANIARKESNERANVEMAAVVKRHMGDWTIDDLWAELDKLYREAEKRGDYRMMREILFMKAKTLGLMQDGNVGPVVNVFAVMDTKATDALKSMGLCQTKKLDVISEQ